MFPGDNSIPAAGRKKEGGERGSERGESQVGANVFPISREHGFHLLCTRSFNAP